MRLKRGLHGRTAAAITAVCNRPVSRVVKWVARQIDRLRRGKAKSQGAWNARSLSFLYYPAFIVDVGVALCVMSCPVLQEAIRRSNSL